LDLSSIVIVGGGAGGLELACKLGRKLGPDRVTLVDAKMYHIWKPSLHEVAAGTLDIHQEGLSYPMLAHNNGFNFVLGAMEGLNTDGKQVEIAAVRDDVGDEVLPKRVLHFGTLVISVGSQSNYFGVKGAQDFTISLDGPQQAESFRLKMLKQLATLDLRKNWIHRQAWTLSSLVQAPRVLSWPPNCGKPAMCTAVTVLAELTQPAM